MASAEEEPFIEQLPLPPVYSPVRRWRVRNTDTRAFFTEDCHATLCARALLRLASEAPLDRDERAPTDAVLAGAKALEEGGIDLYVYYGEAEFAVRTFDLTKWEVEDDVAQARPVDAGSLETLRTAMEESRAPTAGVFADDAVFLVPRTELLAALQKPAFALHVLTGERPCTTFTTSAEKVRGPVVRLPFRGFRLPPRPPQRRRHTDPAADEDANAAGDDGSDSDATVMPSSPALSITSQ